jgi:hypothetical protein
MTTYAKPQIGVIATIPLSFSSPAFAQQASVIVIRATQPGGAALDCTDADGTNGPVAKALASALKSPKVTIAQLFDKLNDTVAKETKNSQMPSIVSSAPIDVFFTNTRNSYAVVVGKWSLYTFSSTQVCP